MSDDQHVPPKPAADATTLTPLIRYAPTQAEKNEQRQQEKHQSILAAEAPGVKNRRDEDYFIGGPLDGMVTKHQANGPRAHNDPKGHWADYYIRDTMLIPETGDRVPGYHLYSSARGFHDSGYQRQGHKARFNLGLRTALFRKCYYYVAFLEERIITLDGIRLDEFHGVLTLS